MARDLSTIDPDKLSDLSQNPYYKKIQKELKEKTSSHQSQGRRPGDTESIYDPERVHKTQEAVKVQPQLYEDKVELKSFKWSDKKENVELSPSQGAQPTSSIDLKSDGIHVLRVLGVKIDFSNKLTSMRQTYMQLVVQSRSHNFFMSKFAAFKVGMLGQLLSALGIGATELDSLKNKALEGAVKENIGLMAENMYTLELTELIYGTTRKTKKSLAMLREVEAQLKAQMGALGKPDYWTPVRMSEERLKQCKRIQDEFKKERDELGYQMDYYRMSV